MLSKFKQKFIRIYLWKIRETHTHTEIARAQTNPIAKDETKFHLFHKNKFLSLSLFSLNNCKNNLKFSALFVISDFCSIFYSSNLLGRGQGGQG